MTSRKRSSKKKTSPQSSSGNPCTNEEIVPKEEFEVEQEQKEAYWDALCDPSRFYRISSGVVFRVLVHGESAADPPEEFFTCYKAFLTCCRMWFPIPEAIIRALDRFKLSISQLNVTALQNFLSVLILSYELGMDLSPDDFEGLRSTRNTSIDYSYRMAPKRHMSIIQGHTSNAKGWFERFFYVRIDGASLEENCLPLFRGKWNFNRANSILPVTPRDLFAKRDLLRNGPFFWDSFTLDRIQNAVALYRSRGIFRPLRASDMNEPHPDAVPDQRERVRRRKDKVIALEDKTLSQKIFRYPDRTRVMGVEPARLPFRTTSLPTFLLVLLLQCHWMTRRGEKWSRKGMRVFNSTLDGSFREARLSHFKAEEIERKFIRFQNEVAERERRQAESHSELSFNADFSFLSEVAEMSGLMDGCAQAESMVPPIEGRIRELWEPIEVSEDTTEAGADAADEGGEVDQPAESFGASISGYLDLDL
ncbi:hypothetical protein F2Q69_00006721 [Brassica cretica]|uniref:Uncharacterized protein n=1 Tax=Brassica cretica TaxID=69181 RepID=A0A8S9P6C0_BRACR|nr:hypothetical protein F2Q69_00006721 [Brassica cretica]